MYKRFCDECGREIDDNYVNRQLGGPFPMGKGTNAKKRYHVNISIVPSERYNEEIHLCYECAVHILYQRIRYSKLLDSMEQAVMVKAQKVTLD